MAKVTKIEPQIPALPTRKKVAVYSRVSMETELIRHSLSSQVSYYSKLMHCADKSVLKLPIIRIYL